jgi:hypothetical protein
MTTFSSKFTGTQVELYFQSSSLFFFFLWWENSDIHPEPIKFLSLRMYLKNSDEVCDFIKCAAKTVTRHYDCSCLLNLQFYEAKSQVSIHQLIFVMLKTLCFLCGTDWILKYYLDELRCQNSKLRVTAERSSKASPLTPPFILPSPHPNA